MVGENDFLKIKKQEPLTSEVDAKNDMEITEKHYAKIGETFTMIVKKISNLSIP